MSHDDLVKRLRDPYGLHQVSSHCAALCDEAAAHISELTQQRDEALVARDAAGYVGTSPAETIMHLSEELRAAEMTVAKARELVASLKGTGTHDEGCDLDPEYGKQTGRPKCTCGLKQREDAAHAFLTSAS